MTGSPLVEITGVVRHYPAATPLRIASLVIHPGERLAIEGLDASAAEALIHLITGAALPDEGEVRLDGRNTREIATDTEWLASLDTLGIVTARAVLIDKLPIAANLALPLTISIEPIPDEYMRKVSALAAEVGLAADRLTAPASTLTPAERTRLHLARALALNPRLLLLEHPTAALEPVDSQALGATLRTLSSPRSLAWLALTNDNGFARAAGAARRHLLPDGRLRKRWW